MARGPAGPGRRDAVAGERATGPDRVALIERWLRGSGVPAFVLGHARPAAVLRRWPAVLAVAVGVAGTVLVATIVAGYGAIFRSVWAQAGLIVGALLLGYLGAVVGLVEIALFALRWFARTAWRSGAGMLRVLPVLLVAVVFTFLSAETWQSIGRLTGTPLVLATLLVVVLGLLPLLRPADDDYAGFDDTDQVRAALPQVLLGTAVHPAAVTEPLLLGLSERLNLRLVGALGRALVAATVGLAVTAFFLVFGVLVVDATVTAAWSGGPADVWWQFTVGEHRYTLTAEHVRVAMFLGVFSALYFIVSASTDRQLAEALSADTRAHLRQCLAVRAVYRTVSCVTTAPSGRAANRRPGGRVRHRQNPPAKGLGTRAQPEADEPVMDHPVTDPPAAADPATVGVDPAVPTPAPSWTADEPAPREECGVFGVFAPGEDVAKLTYYGLYALQHRGQEAAGIAVSDGAQIVVFKDLGLVSQVFDEQSLSSLHGHIAIGHTRYSTTGATTWENAQPTFGTTSVGTGIALGHNGNLVNAAELAGRIPSPGAAYRRPAATTDSDVITRLLAGAATDTGLAEAAMTLLPSLSGAFCLVFCDENTLYAARDRHGVRPLVLGRLERGWVIASETAALDIVGASFVREVEPGELLAIDDDGLRSSRFAPPEPKGCLFEFVYLARPDTAIAGRSVYATRVEIGRRLAGVEPVDADMVIPTPDSGTPAAIGYAAASGIPYGQGLVKNAYVGRTFIQPSQTIRQLGIRLKLNPLRDVIRGKRLVVVDDSIVRGNTQRALVRMLREAGAIEVHVRIASPPVRWPCFYGIDFPSRAELVANAGDTESVRRSIGADSLAHVSLADLVAASEQPRTRLCTACFTGDYPIPIPDQVGKHVLEGIARSVEPAAQREADAMASGPTASHRSATYGASDALHRP
jgi:amidophosphoribosyltransferase